MPRAFLGLLCLVWLLAFEPTNAGSYGNKVVGYGGSFDDVEVTIESRSILHTTSPDAFGDFEFTDLSPGDYFVKVHAEGYRSTPARKITVVDSDDQVAEETEEQAPEPFTLVELTGDAFEFHWEEDQSTSGYEYSAHIIEPLEVIFLDEVVEVVDNSAATNLLRGFNASLFSEEQGAVWTREHAYRLLQTFESIPSSIEFPRSMWKLTNEELHNDIEFEVHDNESVSVRISQVAFANAEPKVVEIEGKRGIWFSHRLHPAVIRFITEGGTKNYDEILQRRFGVAVNHPNFSELTENTTGESDSSFQEFLPEEIVNLINILEEMPRGFHVIPELRYIVRRVNGMPHPLYPNAPAVAWPSSQYIEFMEDAFLQTSIKDLHRLIVHEKAHFLWAHLLDETLKMEWIELGGWYEDSESPSGWSTTLTTQFASAYAHAMNPNEDMAESIADFIVNPDVLRSRAIAKYEFVRDRVMQGNIYVSMMQEDLTFEVYNLYPDYVFPGKIRRVDIRVEGEPHEDKSIRVEIELHALDTELEGAAWAHTRIASDIGTFFDLYLYPRDEDGRRVTNGLVLSNTASLSKYGKAGYWIPRQITLEDNAGNLRFQGANDFGWQMYFDNPEEDYFTPQYIAESAELDVVDSVHHELGRDHEIQILNVVWDVDENNAMDPNWACLAVTTLTDMQRYRIEDWGKYRENRCHVNLLMPDYMPTGEYTIRRLLMKDAARNYGDYVFLEDGAEQSPRLQITTDNPDGFAPEIDLASIVVEANPTNPNDPDGETNLRITYLIRDDISGFLDTAVRIRNPQGTTFFRWHEGPDRDLVFPTVPLNEWYTHTLTWVLPAGSVPGTWGLTEMTTYDRAENTRHYDLTESIQIVVQNSRTIHSLSNRQDGTRKYVPVPKAGRQVTSLPR